MKPTTRDARPQQQISRRRDALERSRQVFLETIRRERSPSRGEVVEQHDGYIRVAIVGGDASVPISFTGIPERVV